MKVFVYFNLRKHVWSVKALQGPNKGRVIAHSKTVVLKNVQGKVSEAGRQWVLSEQQKNVHAGIVGELVSFDSMLEFAGVEITYNPYRYSSFVYKEATEKAFDRAESAYMDNKRVFVTP